MSPLGFLPPLTIEPFPTLQELAYAELHSPKAEKPRDGLFNQLLESRPEVLHIDASEHPDKYDTETIALLRDLVNRRLDVRELDEEDLLRLDRATLDFATATPKAETKKPPTAPKKVAVEDSGPVMGVDVPASDMPPFWWL